MKTVKSWIALLSAATLVFSGCHELGHVGGPGDYGSVGANIFGEVEYIDTRSSQLEIRSDSGRTSLLFYDSNTRVVYQQRNYTVSNLEPGDQVAVRTRTDRDGRLYAELVTVREGVQDRVYRGAAGVLRGTVLRNDPRYSSMLIDTDDHRQLAFYYDNQTRVRYRNRDYPLKSIQAGDHLNVRTRPSNQPPPPFADLITVTSTAQDRASSSAGAAGRLESIDGRVEYVDSSRGTFEVRGQKNRLIVVNLQHNPPRAVSDRFNRLRNGDNVRVQGRFINQDRFELENFL